MRKLTFRAFHRGEGTPQGVAGEQKGAKRRSGMLNRIAAAIVALTATVALVVPTAYAVTADSAANSSVDTSAQAGANGSAADNSESTDGATDDGTGSGDATDDDAADSTADNVAGSTADDTDGNTVSEDSSASGSGSDEDTDAANAADGTDETAAEENSEEQDNLSDEDSADSETDDAVVYADDDSTGTNLLTETFSNTTFEDADEWTVLGDACLTAGRGCKNTSSTGKYQNAGNGKGFLQLTDNSTGRYGAVLNDTNIQTSYGLDITFYQWQFGGNTNSKADGIGFFLTDATADADIEEGPSGYGVGGGLGYSAVTWYGKKSNQGDNKKTGDVLYEGIPHGVLGVGLDTYGNYSAQKEVGGSGTRDANDKSDDHKNSVTVRGAGIEMDSCPAPDYSGAWDRGNCENNNGGWYGGYGIIARSGDGIEDIATQDPLTNGSDAYGSLVRITVSPKANDGSQTLNVFINETNVLKDVTLSGENALPDLVHFGFSASTGSVTAAHFIRDLKVSTVEPVEGDLLLTKTLNTDSDGGSDGQTVFSEGDDVPYKFVITNVSGGTLRNVQLSDVFVKDLACVVESTNASVTMPATMQAGERWICTGSMKLDSGLTSDDSGIGWSADKTTFTNKATVTYNTESGESGSVSATETIDTVAPLDEPDHTKTISGCDEDCEFTLNLDVTGGTSGGSSSQPADVVIVLDRSTSMSFSMGSFGSDSRMSVAKEAIKKFADELLTSDLDNRLSLVTFSSSGYENGASATTRQTWTKAASDINSALDGISVPGSARTNWQAGFQQAADLLKSARSDANQYVVFLSDGDPSHYFTNSGSEWSSEQIAYDKAVEAAKELGKDVTIFSVGVSSDPKKMDDLSGDLASDGFKSQYYSGTSESELEQAIQSIVQIVSASSSYTNVSISDTLSEYMDFAFETGDWDDSDIWVDAKYVGNSDTQQPELPELTTDNVVFSNNDSNNNNYKTITVSFGEDFVLADGVKYTLHFKVKPTQKAFDDAEWTTEGISQDFPSNAKDEDGYGAYLTYTPVTSVSGGSSGGSAEEEKIPYDEQPTFTVSASTLTIEKKWEGDDPVDTIKVSVYQDDSESAYTTVNLEESTDGTWSTTIYVPAGPDGHTYSVEEEAIAGWDPSYSYEVTTAGGTVIDDGVKLKGLCAQAAKATITNNREILRATQGLIKYIDGRNWDEDDVFTFLITSESKGAIAPKNATAVEDKPGQWLIDVDYSNVCEPGEEDSNIRCIAIEFEAPTPSDSKNHEYSYTVTEVEPDDNALDGMVYSKAKWSFKLTLNLGSNGEYVMVAQDVVQILQDDGTGPSGNNVDGTDNVEPNALAQPIEFTNYYAKPATSLPMTGGDTTALTIMIVGSGLLLLAGGAWLLSRRRRI